MTCEKDYPAANFQSLMSENRLDSSKAYTQGMQSREKIAHWEFLWRELCWFSCLPQSGRGVGRCLCLTSSQWKSLRWWDLGRAWYVLPELGSTLQIGSDTLASKGFGSHWGSSQRGGRAHWRVRMREHALLGATLPLRERGGGERQKAGPHRRPAWS